MAELSTLCERLKVVDEIKRAVFLYTDQGIVHDRLRVLWPYFKEDFSRPELLLDHNLDFIDFELSLIRSYKDNVFLQNAVNRKRSIEEQLREFELEHERKKLIPKFYDPQFNEEVRLMDDLVPCPHLYRHGLFTRDNPVGIGFQVFGILYPLAMGLADLFPGFKMDSFSHQMLMSYFSTMYAFKCHESKVHSAVFQRVAENSAKYLDRKILEFF